MQTIKSQSPSRRSLSAAAATTAKLLALICCLAAAASVTSAERDFNFNDSQVPVLEPKDEPPSAHAPAYSQDPYAAEVSRCHYADSEIVLSLVLKSRDWSDLSDNKKAKTLDKLSKFFAIPKEFITMESVTKRDLNEMQKESLREGSNKCHNNRRLGRVNLMIGCGASYFSMGEPIANQIGAQMKDGSIDNITGQRFGWWAIWRKHDKSGAQRYRRDIEGSGEDETDDYTDDYDYDADEDEDGTPETVTETNAVPTHAHRHHHGVAQGEDADGTTDLPEDNQTQTNRSTLTTPHLLDASNSSLPTTTPAPEVSSAGVDELEPRVENSPPMIRNRLQKLAVTSGKSFTFTVPEDTFYDTEDITNLRLVLTDQDGHQLKPTSWLQFNPETRVLYGLPLDDSVSKWSYQLTATDSGNESVTEILELSVQQHRGVRTVNHEINIAVKLNEKQLPNIDWQLKLMRGIADTLGDETTGAIVVREVRQTPQDANAATFVYFNETLPTNECPEAELNNLVQRLDAGRLSELVYPTLGVKSITGQLIGSCLKSQLHKPKPTTHMSKNLPPTPRNQVDRVNATVGHLLVYKVPSDTFYDPNDNELTLTLKTKEHTELPPRHWLQFDSKNQEFYGIPKSGDIGSEEYMLVAEDSGGLSATDALVVVVSHAPKKEFSAFFKAYLSIRHDQFNADLQRKFVERVSHLFGDPVGEYVQIRSITTHHDSDGTIVNFYNTTLYKMHNRCPDEEIEAARSVYLMQDNLLRDSVKKAFGPELNLTNVQLVPLGACHPQTDVTHREYPATKTEEPTLKSTFPDNYLYTVILPAVIIVVMILIASLIACCLHRRRHKSGKMELGDEEERKAFRTKGIPVIFQDELDEKPEIGKKSPTILKIEKPPLLPPSNNTTAMNGDNDVDEYVPPPAVVMGGREARGKSPATPSYRKPPPYVSP